MLFEFGNLLGLYALLALVPLVILYLIKPKPTKLKVPSLMFFMKHEKSSTIHSLFRYFQRDLLFLLQLLVLLFLALSIAQPSLMLNRDVVSNNIVFVLDVSASSQVIEDGKTRLDIAKEKIGDLATFRNSLVLLKSSPVIALEDAGRSELRRYLDRTEATDENSDIASAISLAGEMLGEKNGRIVVVSDFIESKGVDADVAKNFMESRGIGVDFVDTKMGNRSNIGIIDMVISGEDVNLYVKNYNNYAREVQLNVNNEINKFDIAANSVEPFVFTLNSNLTEVNILNEDDFIVDNKVYIARPYSDKIKVLYITNKPSKFIKAVLSSISAVEVTIAEPPIIPENGFDVYLIADVNKNALISGTFNDLLKEVSENGKKAIVVAQRDSPSVDYENLLPFDFANFTSGGLINVDQVNRFTKDIDFGSVQNIFDLSNDSGSRILSVNNVSVVSLYYLGEGTLAYYGIIESESEFELSPGYPIFWSNFIYSLTGREDLNDVNLRTGFVVEGGNQTKTLDKVGVYDLDGKTLVANLLNERESDINFVDEKSSVGFVSGELEPIKTDVDYRLDIYLIILALLILLFEFVYIKVRGEI